MGVGWLAVLGAVLCCGVEAPAATLFSNDLKSIGATDNDNGTDDSSEHGATYNNLTAGELDVAYREEDGDSDARVDFSNAGALFDVGGLGDNGRNYLVTQDKDYHLDDFTASFLFTTTSSVPGWTVMFGVGTAQVNTGFYNLPDYRTDNAAALIELNSGNTHNSYLFHDPDEGFLDSQEQFSSTDSIGEGTHRVAMSYDASDSQITWKIINIGNDSTIATFSRYVDGTGGGYNVLGDWNAGEDAAIFFGGDGVVISDFRVTPEPSAALLALFGALGLLGLRCRR